MAQEGESAAGAEETAVAALEETVVETSPAPAVARPTTERRPAAPTPPSQQVRADASVPEIPVVVTTKTPKAEVEILPSVDTLTYAEIRQRQRFSTPDFLRFVPGTSVVQAGNAGAVTSLFVRGTESDHTVVLLNGRRLPAGLAGQYQLEFLDISLLESVQLQRGAVSSLYGSDAIGGALDLRSTDARFVETNGVSTYLEGGSFATVRGGASASIREGRFGAVFDFSGVETSNDRPESDYLNQVLRSNIALDLSDGAWFDLLGQVQSSDLQVPGSAFNNPGFPEAQLNTNESLLLSPRLTVERENWELSTFYSYTRNELEATRTVFLNDNALFQSGHEGEVLWHIRPGEDATYSLGAAYYEYRFDREPLTPGIFNQPADFRYAYTSVFGQADVALPGDFGAIASVRHDGHDTYEDATTFSVQLNRRFAATGTTLFGKVATGYKAPSGQDILFTLPGVDLSTLEPEETESWEIGVRQELGGGQGTVAATWFHNDITNLIDNDPFTFAFSQVDAETRGLEVEARLAPTDCLEAYANYTYLDATVVDGAGFAGLPGDRLLRRPRHTFSAGLIWSGDRLDLGADIQGAADRIDGRTFGTNEPFFVDDYVVTRLFGSFEIGQNWEAYARIENLFDEEFEYTRGFAAPGFEAFGGVRLVFGP